jgi:hypothetical protein
MENPTLLDKLTEVAACIEAARLELLPIIALEEQRESARLRKARQRMHAPTTHEQDAPLSRRA